MRFSPLAVLLAASPYSPSYAGPFGRHVPAVEYRGTAFGKPCPSWSDRTAVVRRDVNLTRHGLRRWCD